MIATAKDNKLNTAHEKGHTAGDAESAAEHFKKEARHAAADVKDGLEDVARRTGHHVRELADSAEHSIESAGATVTAKIRNNPVQSSLIALGLGLLIGTLYRR